MRSLILSIIFTVCYLIELSAQSITPFFQYNSYQTFANPAIPFEGYNGLHNLQFDLTHRMESANSLNEGPVSQVFNLTWISASENRFQMLLGGAIVKRQFGPTSFTDLFIRLGALSFRSQEFGNFSAAVNIGMNQFGLKASETHGLAPNDPLLNTNYQEAKPNVGLGVYYKSPSINDRYDITLGFSIPQVNSFDLVNYSVENGDILSTFQPQYYGLIGLNINRGDFSYWELTSWVKKLPDIDLSLEFMGKLHLKNPAIWFGAGISTLQNIRVAYGIKFWYYDKNSRKRAQTKRQYPQLEMAYNFNWGNIPSQLNNGLELRIVWLIPKIQAN